MFKRLRPVAFFLFPVLFACTEKEQEPQVIPVDSVSINQSSASLSIGETLQLTASVLPSAATNKDISWSSGNQSVASVSSSGLVTAVGEGTTTITASAGGKKGECSISVAKAYIAVTEVKFEKTELSLYEGDEETLIATVLPEDASDKTITWSSSDKSIASVESGKVKAVGKGTAKITASAGGKSASCNIEVLRPVSGISLNKTTLELPLEKAETLIASVIPSDATLRGEITWSSSNAQVATVDGGKVTAMSMGSTVITATLEGFKAECTVTVKGMVYGKIAITNLKPVEILPVIGQVEVGDKQIYDHIEHLRLAESTRIRDMMWEYGANPYSIEEYRSLMGRLEVMMVNEVPPDYDKNDIISVEPVSEGSDYHSSEEWDILNRLIKHGNLGVIYSPRGNYIQVQSSSDYDHSLIKEYSDNHPNSLIILAQSTGADYDEIRSRERYENEWFKEENVLQFSACMNRFRYNNGRNIFQVCQIDTEYPDDESTYGEPMSYTNGKNDLKADRHHIITIGSSESGVLNYNEDPAPRACFPYGFHDDVLFAGRAFPNQEYPSGKIGGEWSTYQCSYTNYVNAAMAGICFQLKADTKNIDDLLEMLRSTSLTDYAYKGGITQPLHLINLAGVYKKYLTPQNLPTSISSGETVNLEKGYYKGVLFSIPGAEVKVNGEWIAFDNKNKEVILSQNPMSLEWRLNGDLLKRYGYTSGQTVEGQIITVDDKWGGLRLEVPMSIKIN